MLDELSLLVCRLAGGGPRLFDDSATVELTLSTRPCSTAAW